MVEILVPGIVFGSITAVIISIAHFRTRKTERLALIAAGKDAGLFNEGEKKEKTSAALKFGIVAVALGIGLLVGDYLAKSTDINEAVAYFSMMLLFGGSGLLSFYFIQKQINKKMDK
ncbi:DUF6249 domain-containing protein [Saccharicrinis aurantiacus]|uniref:DUF6249 domain-containing protein n=1 Tax=Saccharicrinis aurantiacus TaxID=1849719 RepID=UPI00248F53E6|nr:DUF6249 domain-containing protein [Saccharicrinis aurantiacus]